MRGKTSRSFPLLFPSPWLLPFHVPNLDEWMGAPSSSPPQMPTKKKRLYLGCKIFFPVQISLLSRLLLFSQFSFKNPFPWAATFFPLKGISIESLLLSLVPMQMGRAAF